MTPFSKRNKPNPDDLELVSLYLNAETKRISFSGIFLSGVPKKIAWMFVVQIAYSGIECARQLWNYHYGEQLDFDDFIKKLLEDDLFNSIKLENFQIINNSEN